MEHFCEPTARRYEDDDDDDEIFDEVQLAVPVEDFLVYRWDWKDLQAFLTDGGVTPKRLWLTENAFLIVEESGDTYCFYRNDYIAASMVAMDGLGLQVLMLVQLHQSNKSTAELGVFWCAVMTSNSFQLTIKGDIGATDALGLPSGPLLSQFLQDSPLLRVLEFESFLFREHHCRALASLQRTDLEITLNDCTLDPRNAEGTFIEWFRHNQVVTELNCCGMGNRIISALSGNNSVRRLIVKSFFVEEEEEEEEEEKKRSLFQALPSNMGIEHVSMIVDNEMSVEFWCLLFHSLSTHPRIERVTLDEEYSGVNDLSAESKSTMMNAILQMLQHNTVVRTIDLPRAFDNEEVYQNTILPRLERNRNCFEVQRRALKRADPSIRPQLLGRALHVVRYNPNLVFRFLSENVPAFVRTEEEEHSAVHLQKETATIVSGQKRKAPL
jgi:hypothetical protein